MNIKLLQKVVILDRILGIYVFFIITCLSYFKSNNSPKINLVLQILTIRPPNA